MNGNTLIQYLGCTDITSTQADLFVGAAIEAFEKETGIYPLLPTNMVKLYPIGGGYVFTNPILTFSEVKIAEMDEELTQGTVLVATNQYIPSFRNNFGSYEGVQVSCGYKCLTLSVSGLFGFAEELPSDIKLGLLDYATGIYTNYLVSKNNSGQQIKREKAGLVEVEYFANSTYNFSSNSSLFSNLVKKYKRTYV